jgi:hypothetical protein
MAGSGQIWNIDFQSITIDNESIDLPGSRQPSRPALAYPGPTETVLPGPTATTATGSCSLAGTSGAPTITDGTSYTPNADFSSATEIGGGWRCVYRGTGNGAIVNGLTASTTYRFIVYEMDGAGPGSKYLTTVGTNAGNVTTIHSSFLTWSSGTARTLSAENFWSWPASDRDASTAPTSSTALPGTPLAQPRRYKVERRLSPLTSLPGGCRCFSFNDYNSMDVTGWTPPMATGAAFGSGVSGARGSGTGSTAEGAGVSTIVSYSDPNGWKNTYRRDRRGWQRQPHVAYLWLDSNTPRRNDLFFARRAVRP